MNKLFRDIKSYPEGVKASIAFFVANIVTKGIGYITTPIYTRMLSAREYGQTSVFFTWISILGIVAMFCLSYGVFNNGMVDYPDKRDEYSLSMLALSNVITIIFGIVLVLLYPYISDKLEIPFPLVVLMIIVFMVQPAYNFWVAKQRYEYKYKSTTLWSITCAILSPLTAIICIRAFPDDKLYARIVGAEGALILIYIGFYIYIIAKAKFKINTKYWKAALLFNFPLIPHYLSAYLLSSSDKIMISKIVSDSATAYYSVAYSVASVVLIIWTAANASLLPFTYEKCKKSDYKSISDVTIPILLFFEVACIGIVLLAPEVVAIMATRDYTQAIYAIPPIVAGVFYQAQYYVYANIIYYYKKSKFVMIGSLVATTLNIVLNYLLIPKYGFIAAGYTTLFCYLIQANIDFISLKYILKRNVYDMRKISIMSLLLIVVALFSNILYSNTVVRYVLISAIVLFVIIKYKTIAEYFDALKRRETK